MTYKATLAALARAKTGVIELQTQTQESPLIDEAELEARAEYFEGALSGPLSRHEWLVTRVLDVAAPMMAARPTLSTEEALSRAKELLFAALSDEDLTRLSCEPPSHSAIARLVLPHLPGFVP